MNRLAKEKSPYLLQHGHNPVEWYPWCDEVFERARRENKPVLLSIGYSSCHWCHVMARESFADSDTAEIMNTHFLNIKVDREEHPDIDALYMSAVQAMTGQGGWPLTVFLDPGGAPFYGGTYFPPRDGFGLPSFTTVLHEVARMYRENSGQVREVTEKLKQLLIDANPPVEGGDDPALPDSAFEGMARFYDGANGGFGTGGPKFPYAMALEFLLFYGVRRGRTEAVKMVEKGLEKMARGGICDHLGGGFHRYSVDERWEVPHFEKMLYDNALLLRLYSHAFQATGRELYREVALGTADFILREMTAPEGGFHAALDADSAGVEGSFYVWKGEEVLDLLGKEEGELFNRAYALDGVPALEGGSPLMIKREWSALAASEEMPLEKMEEILAGGRERLFAAREKRQRPGGDDKIIVAWNGLAVTALAEAAGAFDNAGYLDAAVRAVRFLLAECRDGDGRLLRYYKEGQSSVPAYLEDYALLGRGCLALYDQTLDEAWLGESQALGESIIALFYDSEKGLFYDRGRDGSQLIVPQRGGIDNDIPSGNAATADLLLRLFHMTGEERWEEMALTIVRSLGAVKEHPLSFGHLLCVAELNIAGPFEVAIIEGDDTTLTGEVHTVLKRAYLPHLAAAKSGAASSAAHLLEGEEKSRRSTTVHICYNKSCQRPATGIESVRKIIETLYPAGKGIDG